MIVSFLMRSFIDKNIKTKQVNYNNDQLSYLSSKTFLDFEYVTVLANQL